MAICAVRGLRRQGRPQVPCCDAAIADIALRPRPNVDAAALRLAGLRSTRRSSPRRCSMRLTGARVFLKAETLQRTGSVQFRGPYNSSRKSHRRLAQAACGLFVRQSCAGVAAAALLLACRRSSVMPADAPRASASARPRSAPKWLYDRASEEPRRRSPARRPAQPPLLVPAL